MLLQSGNPARDAVRTASSSPDSYLNFVKFTCVALDSALRPLRFQSGFTWRYAAAYATG